MGSPYFLTASPRYYWGMPQGELFALELALPEGFEYRPGFITAEEEADLLAELGQLPLREAKYKEFTAKRRIVSYGGTYDFSNNELLPAGPMPPFLRELRERLAAWAAVPAQEFTHALIAEYQSGTQLGWHRDVPQFELVCGVSLAGAARMKLRRYPYRKGSRAQTLAITLEPRSAYIMRGEARWGWQHSIPPTKNRRYSITFRSLRHIEATI
jgi:alkylated DNA repair dioxygenase AlkB